MKTVPLWMVILIVVNSTLLMGITQYYLLRQEFQKNLQLLAKTTKSPEELVQVLKQEVLPQKGYVTPLKWKDVNPKLALSSNYSSAQGAARVKQSIQGVPGLQNQRGGCGV